MRFLLDENIPMRTALALRSEGHDVVRVQETPLRGAGDEAVWAYAAEILCVFVTADLDFPLPGPRPTAMVLVRGFERVSVQTFTTLVVDAVRALGDGIIGHLVVVSPGRLRQRRL